MTGRFLLGELLIRNAFDTRYIPLAFPYPSFAPSGFMGEMGAPRTGQRQCRCTILSSTSGGPSMSTQIATAPIDAGQVAAISR